jgi:hypothetical protein
MEVADERAPSEDRDSFHSENEASESHENRSLAFKKKTG